jgi:hypothetical protein
MWIFANYEMLIGTTQWACTMGQLQDIALAVSLLSQFC